MSGLIDTHCHIHFSDYGLDPNEVIVNANKVGVTGLLCVGCTLEDSEAGIEFVKNRDNAWATIGIHPHEAKRYVDKTIKLQQFRSLAGRPKVVAIGECGLDYYYNHSSKEDQRHILRFQLTLAQEFDLPVIFHVREAFDDFFAVLSDFQSIRGVVHSYTANTATLDKILNLGLYIGLNGIMTFTKDAQQLKMAKNVPLNRLLLETDAPFLTPAPFRGKVCEPKHIRVIGEFLSKLRGEQFEKLSNQTTENAKTLFNLS